MKKILLIMLALVSLAFVSCSKEWTSEVELGVFSTRLNLDQDGIDFVVTVFSNQDWSAEMLEGGDWCVLDGVSGNGLGSVHASASVNFDDYVRVAKIQLQAASGKQVIVNVVQSGAVEKAADYSDSLL